MSKTFAVVVAALRAGLVRVSSQAPGGAGADGLILHEIEAATCAGECIEDYPDDPRGSSCLVLGREPAGQAILITVYLPDPQRWTEDFRRRRGRNAGEAE